MLYNWNCSSGSAELRTDKLKNRNDPDDISTASCPPQSPTQNNSKIPTKLQMRNIAVSSGDLKKIFAQSSLENGSKQSRYDFVESSLQLPR